MNIYEKLTEINKKRHELEDELDHVGTPDEWVNEAIKQGLIVKNRELTKVSVCLEKYGPEIRIWSKVQDGSYTKLIGSAEYTAFSKKWKILNFDK